ncbi:BZ3500_MvSof-1268-A1-R1_Chr10-1g02708 [Microbotryum saponariae]|uniref:BZ3500_MvSof-1268-A1-R1_Chr10-1g02708 protein n=1 Tax=Microbotryum saponariae TaxID=289078 RepID=A0A2X0L8W3_9BASI|nr:BZ3500_MvSof-1268-A1-R1_Chr10-1g02708 [Microbotryum saponariae]SDA06197.1 BZ3501_MvSof-1269-A2-R1_Chr10-1g02309 [Microbotryum saponariae]
MLPWSRASNSRQSPTDEGTTASPSPDNNSSNSSSVLPTSTSTSTSTSSSTSSDPHPHAPPSHPPSSPSGTRPSAYLAQHHRNSSSTRTPSFAPPTSEFRRAGVGSSSKSDAQAIATDNDPWEEQTDEEDDTIASIRRNVQGALDVSSASGSGGNQHKERASSPPVAVGSGGSVGPSGGGGGSWSFNPFSIVSGGSSKSHTQPQDDSYTPTQRAGPDAVAAALNSVGRGRPPPSPMATGTTTISSSAVPGSRGAKRSVSYLATASKVQAEADEKIDEAARERKASATGHKDGSTSLTPPPTTSPSTSPPTTVDAPPNPSDEPGPTVAEDGVEEEEETEATRAKQSSTCRIEQCRRQIRPEVDEIVRDPISVLGRLAEPPPPPPPDSPIQPRKSTSSIGDRSTTVPQIGGDDEGEDDEEDPAKGYIQLDATNISSGGPEIVEFNRVEDPEENGELGRERRRRRKFVDCLGAETVDLAALRTLAWAGIPNELRPMAWQLLMGYMPAPSARRVSTLARKRQEYADAVRLAFSRGVKGLDGPIWHQISIDVPRTNPGIQLWQCEGTQRSLERILYVWAIRHPASGYVQGINDLVTPFFQVFLSSYIDSDPEAYDVAALPPAVLEALEADSFWCLSKLLDGIQDNYIFAQPGITRQVARMKELCARVDVNHFLPSAPLAHHLEENSVEFIQFAFRWMNCLLMREMSVKNIVRMWDTYLAEGQDAFSEFHLYVCLAFLVRWSDRLREMDFQSIIMFLQSLPTQQWSDKNTELLLSEAFMWSRTFVAR